MAEDTKERIATLVAGLGGDSECASTEELWGLVYDDLRRLARWRMAGAVGHTLQPTALVHEAYMRLVDQSRVDWRGRSHFKAVASKVMRNLLVDHARRKASAKRGGDRNRITLAEGISTSKTLEIDLEQMLSVDAALGRLAEHDSKQARVVELRFFGGLTVAEVAEVIGVSKRTVEGYWTHARAWLLRELSHGADD
jgi:RNA polymerase sigma factor (TIGR02999 family)